MSWPAWVKKHGISLLMLLILLFITGQALDRLSTQLLVKRIEGRGINYDTFREMKLSAKNLEMAQNRMDVLQSRHTALKRAKGIDSIAYLTVSMLAMEFDLMDGKLIDERVFLKVLPHISSSPGYRSLYRYYQAVLKDIKCFPVPRITGDEEDISYVDTWSEPRSYGGKRKHEGTDLMARNKIRGFYPILSITEGVIEKMGWLEQGGYRIGIRSSSGGYFYYAHLSEYANSLKEGDTVLAGQLLGFMGDSGYGEEGTTGQFDVHLHMGIYVQTESGELSVNPYYILKLLEKYRVRF